jgi:YidC/Oxa1 family membrane protein insertase
MLGANVTRAELIHHKDAHHQDSNVVLMDNSKERVYLAQTGLVGAPVGTAWPTHKTAMRLVSPSRFKDGEDSLVLRFESDADGWRQTDQILYASQEKLCDWCPT